MRHPRVIELLEHAADSDEPVEPDGPLAGIVVDLPLLRAPAGHARTRCSRTPSSAPSGSEHEVGDMREPVTRLESQMGGLASAGRAGLPGAGRAAADIDKALAGGRDARQLAVDAQREADSTRRALAALRPAAAGIDPNGDAPSEPTRPPRGRASTTRPVPMATLTLHGNFMELNPGFRELVGYSEEEFASARWPSNVDRARLDEHTQLRERLAAGELEGEHVELAYMHSAGLVVELSGRMSLVRTPDGAPDHLLLTLDVR